MFFGSYGLPTSYQPLALAAPLAAIFETEGGCTRQVDHNTAPVPTMKELSVDRGVMKCEISNGASPHGTNQT
ncbi:hypothetical protein IF1G_11076 [Cordyceps javanica]|uniref:Uncharacterized protein n=1 Tax=Cordyceps javanica TaxID=43265 RepID=A0A545ULA1_9HYPO|nr:hypothetical protein IF1G_11076 [Cordyceps javanica]